MAQRNRSSCGCGGSARENGEDETEAVAPYAFNLPATLLVASAVGGLVYLFTQRPATPPPATVAM